MDEQQRQSRITYSLGILLNYLNGFDKLEDFTEPYVQGLNSLKAEATRALDYYNQEP